MKFIVIEGHNPQKKRRDAEKSDSYFLYKLSHPIAIKADSLSQVT